MPPAVFDGSFDRRLSWFSWGVASLSKGKRGVIEACQVSRIARVMIHAIGSFHTLTRKPGLVSRIFVHAWNQDMVSSFTSIRDRRRVKMPRLFVV